MRAPTLPDWFPRKELQRPTAEQMGRVENRKRTLTYAGENEVIPLIYGEQLVSGPVIAGPVIDAGPNSFRIIYAVALCWAGENGIERIEGAREGDRAGTFPAITDPNVGATWSQNSLVRVYDGRQTVVNSMLASWIPGFSDPFTGIAYAAMEMQYAPNQPPSSLPQILFQIKGRRCLDPRTNALGWTENPVLHMYDFVTNDEFGMGANLIGAQAAADVADSLYSGIPRSRSGLAIQDSMTEEDALALFAQYAEVLWSYDGRDVSIIPDSPVDTVHPIASKDIIEGSLSLSTVGLDQIPTQVRLMFSDREEPTWASRPAVAQVPEHTMHGMPTSPSSVPLPGVFNRLQAERMAYQRLMRLQTPGRIEWQMTAPGMPYQAGDVVRLPNVRGLQSVDVRLTAQPTMIAPLKYQMAGEIYSASHYPEGAEGVAVPTGGILILRGSGPVPSGWSLMNIGDRLIRDGAPGATGTISNVSFNFGTGAAGAHRGERSTEQLQMLNSPPPGTDPAQNGMPILYINAGSVPGESELHSHSFGGSIEAKTSVPRRTTRLVRRTGTPGLLAPGLAFFGYQNHASAHLSQSVGLNGGYLLGGNTERSDGATTSRTMQTSSRAAHMHNPYVCQPRFNPGSGFVNARMGQEAGEHSHSATVRMTGRLRSIALALFESLGDAALPEGAIVGWEGPTAPEGWAFCTGANGTIDLRERFIYLTSVESAGVEFEDASEITISASGVTSMAGSHNHQRSFALQTSDGFIYALAYNPYHVSTEGSHNHGVSGSVTHNLDNVQRYQLRFIQYIGS